MVGVMYLSMQIPAAPNPGLGGVVRGHLHLYSLYFGPSISGKRAKINHPRLPERGISVAFTLLWSASLKIIFAQIFFVLDAKRSEPYPVRQLPERGEQYSKRAFFKLSPRSRLRVGGRSGDLQVLPTSIKSQ